jgi:2-iminobutanoate/2-iminopropanoate deaminase
MREIVRTEAAPASTSPVAQATRGGGLVFVGGQMPRDMETGRIVEGAPAQARASLAHCLAILEAAGSGADKVMRADVFVTDLGAKDAVNAAFAEVFGDSPPARNMVEISAIGEGAIVEIGLIALA